jgi:hypothetical protein
MEKNFGTVTFTNSIADTFPYIESAIFVLDNNLNWWKKNYKVLEEKIANIIRGVADTDTKVLVRFIIYNGPDEIVKSVTWNGPAIEFTFLETSDKFAKKVCEQLGEKTWEGHKIITENNKLYVLIE